MKTAILSLTAICLFFNAEAQKTGHENTDPNPYDEAKARIHYYEYKLASAEDTVHIKSLLRQELRLSENDKLTVKSIKKSLTATHILFKQTYNGIDVFGGNAKVAISNNNVLFRCIESVYTTAGFMQEVPKTFATEALLSTYKNVELLENKPVYLFNGDVLLPGWYAKFNHGNFETHEIAWWKNGIEYFKNDLRRYAVDTIVDVKIYNPDPISPIGQVYGGIYVDGNDSNQLVLDPLRMTSTVRAVYDNDSFYLDHDRIELVEIYGSYYPIIKSATKLFNYSRSSYQFLQLNAYYHVTKMQEYLQSLGYDLVDYKLRVDATGGFAGFEESFYNPSYNGSPLVVFSEDGVDDAEDADVVIHEYAHAISDDASPNTNSGSERRSLDEAFGDYLAVSYKKVEVPFGSDKVFNWDGHNEFWSGRTVNNPNNINYKSTSFGNIYTNTTLWCDAVFDVWDQIGKTKTDMLMLEMSFGFAANMTFKQAALLMIDADTALYNGANGIVLWKAFDARGILDWTDITEQNKMNNRPYAIKGNVVGAGGLAIVYIEAKHAKAALIDATGREVKTVDLEMGDNEIYTNGLTNGVYFLRMNINGQIFTEKVIIAQ